MGRQDATLGSQSSNPGQTGTIRTTTAHVRCLELVADEGRDRIMAVDWPLGSWDRSSVPLMDTVPPPPSAEKPSGTATAFPPPTGAQIIRALRAPAIGFVWLLLGAIVLAVLIVVAANIGSTGKDTGVDSSDTNAIGVLIGMPFQIAAMALLGSLHFTADGVRGSLFMPPLILTVCYLVMTARSARRGEKIPAAGTRALLGVIVGFVYAVVLTVLTWALAMRDSGSALHAASVSLFFGSWALTGIASFVGSSQSAGARRPMWISSDYANAARVWSGSLIVWVAVAFVVLMIVSAVKNGLWVAVLSPLWGVTAGLDTYGIAHLGGLSFAGETIKIGDFSAIWTIVMIVGAIALATLTSITWHLRRDTRDTSLAQPGSWAVLPATYAAGGIVVWLVPSVVIGGGVGAFGASATLQPAFWLVFVLIVWGGAVEVASRYLAPSLATALPMRLQALLRGPEPADGDSSEPAAVAPAIPDARPLTAEERARYEKFGIFAGVVVGLGIVGWIAVSVVNSQFYSPKDRASAYLDAVVRADLKTANSLAPTDGHQANNSLLTSAIYRAAGHRISGYEIDKVDKQGDTATISVRLKGLGKDVSAKLTLKKDGHSDVLFDKWKIADNGLAKDVSISAPDGDSDVTVNGAAVGRTDKDVWLLPGDYVFDASGGNPWLTSSGEPVTVAADEDFQFAEVPAPVASDAFKAEVQRQVDAYLAACMASTQLEPKNCPNSTFAGPDVRKVMWTMDQAPTVDFSSFDGTFPADLSYGDSGHATVTYEADQSYGFGPRDWQPQTDESDLYLNSVTVTENGSSLVVTIKN